MKISPFLAIALLLPVDASAQSLARPPSARRAHSLPQQPSSSAVPGSAERQSTSIPLSDERFSHLYFDTDDDGATWVRGRPYKARFDASGATLFPFMGSDAPQLYPLATALASARVGGVPIALSAAARAVRDGDRISIAHGAIDEVYELTVDTVEQTFVIRSLPASGELVLLVRLDTELAGSEREDGFVFANERGSVHYGRASVHGARGGTIDVSTQFVDGRVEIRVPSDVLAAAGLPLVVDPLMSFFIVHQNQDQFAADVAYDAANAVYLVVEEEKFASADDDVYTTRVSSTGANMGGAYADLSIADWQGPRVANLNSYDQFLVVASIQHPAVAFGLRYIGGRHTAAAALAYGPTIQISNTSVFANMRNVDVGGDPYPAGTAYYCVAWEWDSATLPETKQVVYRMVDNAAAIGTGETALTQSTGKWAEKPSVSNGNAGQRWTIAWVREETFGTDWDVVAAGINWDGFVNNPAFDVDTTSVGVNEVSVASPFDTGAVVVTYGFTAPYYFGVPSVAARVLTGTAVGILQDLSAIHQYQYDLFNPSADCDGHYLVVARETVYPATQPDVQFETYVLTNGTLDAVESINLDYGPEDARNPSVCAAHSTAGAADHFMTVHDRGSSSRVVWGSLYEPGGAVASYCAGDGSGTACPCANSGTAGHGCQNSTGPAGGLISCGGGASVSSDVLVLTASSIPNGGCLFFQGTGPMNNGAGVAFGDGKLCVAGSILRLGVLIAANGTASFPAAGGPPVSVAGSLSVNGGERFYQGWYRDNASFCSSATFNLTNGVRVSWIP